MQTFEKYPELTRHIKRMYDRGSLGSMADWSNFLQTLNGVLQTLESQNRWIPVEERLPERDEHGESEEVLCKIRKFGNAQNRTETDQYIILWYDGKWHSWDSEDFESNADYMTVICWKPIEPPK